MSSDIVHIEQFDLKIFYAEKRLVFANIILLRYFYFNTKAVYETENFTITRQVYP